MSRLALYIAGVSAALAAFVAIRKQQRLHRRVPVKEAAAMLQNAWANHHTRA
jgi:hypothetical protein